MKRRSWYEWCELLATGAMIGLTLASLHLPNWIVSTEEADGIERLVGSIGLLGFLVLINVWPKRR